MLLTTESPSMRQVCTKFRVEKAFSCWYIVFWKKKMTFWENAPEVFKNADLAQKNEKQQKIHFNLKH